MKTLLLSLIALALFSCSAEEMPADQKDICLKQDKYYTELIAQVKQSAEFNNLSDEELNKELKEIQTNWNNAKIANGCK